jgi:hypothetical protein
VLYVSCALLIDVKPTAFRIDCTSVIFPVLYLYPVTKEAILLGRESLRLAIKGGANCGVGKRDAIKSGAGANYSQIGNSKRWIRSYRNSISASPSSPYTPSSSLRCHCSILNPKSMTPKHTTFEACRQESLQRFRMKKILHQKQPAGPGL